jgi:hypothetical protein
MHRHAERAEGAEIGGVEEQRFGSEARPTRVHRQHRPAAGVGDVGGGHDPDRARHLAQRGVEGARPAAGQPRADPQVRGGGAVGEEGAKARPGEAEAIRAGVPRRLRQSRRDEGQVEAIQFSATRPRGSATKASSASSARPAAPSAARQSARSSPSL